MAHAEIYLEIFIRHPGCLDIAVYCLVFVENTDGIVGLRNDCRAPVYLIGILFF